MTSKSTRTALMQAWLLLETVQRGNCTGDTSNRSLPLLWVRGSYSPTDTESQRSSSRVARREPRVRCAIAFTKFPSTSFASSLNVPVFAASIPAGVSAASLDAQRTERSGELLQL